MINTDDVQIMNHKRVELLCFAQFGVYIHLEGHIILTVEADFEHVDGQTQERHVTRFPASESSLMRLLESSVVSAMVESDGDLYLVFSNGDSLKISKRPEFESYQLKVGAEELIAKYQSAAKLLLRKAAWILWRSVLLRAREDLRVPGSALLGKGLTAWANMVESQKRQFAQSWPREAFYRRDGFGGQTVVTQNGCTTVLQSKAEVRHMGTC